MGPCSKHSKRTVRVFVRDKSGKGRVEMKTVPLYAAKYDALPSMKPHSTAKPGPFGGF